MQKLGMGATAALAQETPDDKRELCSVCLDIAAVGAIADEEARASAGTGEAERIKLIHGIIIRFWEMGFFHCSFAGGIHFYG